jgi:hypothetical protein
VTEVASSSIMRTDYSFYVETLPIVRASNSANRAQFKRSSVGYCGLRRLTIVRRFFNLTCLINWLENIDIWRLPIMWSPPFI